MTELSRFPATMTGPSRVASTDNRVTVTSQALVGALLGVVSGIVLMSLGAPAVLALASGVAVAAAVTAWMSSRPVKSQRTPHAHHISLVDQHVDGLLQGGVGAGTK
ncbi:MAG: hypothetical protein WAN48_09950 [Actinomycetes bacterium]